MLSKEERMKRASIKVIQVVCIVSLALGIALGSMVAFADGPSQTDYRATVQGE